MFLNCDKQKQNHYQLSSASANGRRLLWFGKRWGSAIKLKYQKANIFSDVLLLEQYGVSTKFKISKFLLFRGGKEWIFWSEFQTKFQTAEIKTDTRGLSTVAALSVDPNWKYPAKRWEGLHLGLAEGGPFPSGFRLGSV